MSHLRVAAWIRTAASDDAGGVGDVCSDALGEGGEEAGKDGGGELEHLDGAEDP